MKLTKGHKDLISSWGYRSDDFRQIQSAANKSTYEYNNELISRDKAIELLGIKEYLSGICRSAFHWSAVRLSESNEAVYFNSKKLFN